PPRDLHCFPTRRSSDLETTDSNFDEEEEVNSESDSEPDIDEQFKDKDLTDEELDQLSEKISQDTDIIENPILTDQVLNEYYSQKDRKSTRLNSSHVSIS